MNDNSALCHQRFFSFSFKLLSAATIAASAMFCWQSPAIATNIGNVDQQNMGGPAYANSFVGDYSFGQSFTPSFPAIDAMEFWVGGDANVIVRLREGSVGDDGLGGSIIAESLPVVVDVVLGYKRHHFDFPSRVPLSVGQQYVAELSYSGFLAVSVKVNDPYPGGQEFSKDFPAIFLGQQDLVFREGLHVPEPGSAPICIAALATSLVGRFRWQRPAA